MDQTKEQRASAELLDQLLTHAPRLAERLKAQMAEASKREPIPDDFAWLQTEMDRVLREHAAAVNNDDRAQMEWACELCREAFNRGLFG